MSLFITSDVVRDPSFSFNATGDQTKSQVHSCEFRARHADGSLHWLAAKSVSIFADDEAATPSRILSTAFDVTDRVERGRELELSHSKSIFLASLSHELRGPLQPVVLALDALLDTEQPIFTKFAQDYPDHVRHLHIIQHQVQAELCLVDDLLDLVRGLSGKLVIRPKYCHVHDTVKKAIRESLMKPDTSSQLLSSSSSCPSVHRWHLHLDLAASCDIGFVDPVRIEQVFKSVLLYPPRFCFSFIVFVRSFSVPLFVPCLFLIRNLLTNACKFTPPRGSISISSRRVASSPSIRSPVRPQSSAPCSSTSAGQPPLNSSSVASADIPITSVADPRLVSPSFPAPAGRDYLEIAVTDTVCLSFFAVLHLPILLHFFALPFCSCQGIGISPSVLSKLFQPFSQDPAVTKSHGGKQFIPLFLVSRTVFFFCSVCFGWHFAGLGMGKSFGYLPLSAFWHFIFLLCGL